MKPRLILPALLCFGIICPAALAQWKPIGELSVARCSIGAIYIGEGKVLVMGGSTRMPIENDPMSVPQRACDVVDVWNRRVVPTGSMVLPRSEFVALRTPDSNVVVIGGVIGQDPNGDVTGSVELYDRQSGRWREIGQLKTPRRQHVGGFIDEHRILVTGGREKGYGSLTSSEIFDMRTGTTTKAADFAYPINGATLVASHSDELVVVGGRTGGANSERRSDVYTYNAREDYWGLRGVLAQSVSHVTGIRLWDQRMLICGGVMRDAPLQTAGDVQLESEGKWISIARMGKSRVAAQMAQWSESRLLVIGGVYDDHLPLATTEWVGLGSHSVGPGPALNVPRDRFRALSVPAAADAEPHEYSVVVIGGISSTTGMTASVELLAESDVTLDVELVEAITGTWRVERTDRIARVRFELERPSSLDMRVVSPAGATVLKPLDHHTLAGGVHDIVVDLSSLAGGWYMLEMRSGSRVWREPIVLSR